jgi:hypothetical protein
MTHTPVACTLTADQLRCRAEELLPGLARRATRVTRSTDGAELTFAATSDALAHIASVVDAERRCCQFLHFTLDVPAANGAISLSVRGPAGTGAFLESLDPAFAEPTR